MSYEEDNALVRRIAYSLTKSASHLFEDAVNAGWIGLLEASKKRETSISEVWPAYLAIRIRGAILDMLRSHDFLTRRHRNTYRKLERARRHLEGVLGRAPTQEELAAEMGVSLEKLQSTQSDIDQSFRVAVDIHEMSLPNMTESPESLLETEEALHKAFGMFNQLPSKCRYVAQRYYVDGLSFEQIGNELGVTPTMVSKIHRDVLQFIRPVILSEACTPERRQLLYAARMERTNSH